MNLDPIASSTTWVRTYAYAIQHTPWVLVANGSPTESVSLRLPGPWRNAFTSQAIDDQTDITLPAGWYTVLRGTAE